MKLPSILINFVIYLQLHLRCLFYWSNLQSFSIYMNILPTYIFIHKSGASSSEGTYLTLHSIFIWYIWSFFRLIYIFEATFKFGNENILLRIYSILLLVHLEYFHPMYCIEATFIATPRYFELSLVNLLHWRFFY